MKQKVDPIFRSNTAYWLAVLPAQIARRQIIWERHAAVKRMLDLGFTQASIGRCFGRNSSRGEQLVRMARRTMREMPTAPVVKYYAEAPFLSAV